MGGDGVYRWYWTDHYHEEYHGPFETREEAEAAGYEESFVVLEADLAVVEGNDAVDPEYLIETLDDMNYEAFSDGSYIGERVTAEQTEDLRLMLNNVVNCWIDKYGYRTGRNCYDERQSFAVERRQSDSHI